MFGSDDFGISDEGIALIKRFEGLELESYPDVAGIWTIGYGHTGPEVGPNQEITEAEAEELLRKDLQRFERAVNDAVKVDITQSMFDALVSLSFNIGAAALKSSTTIKRLNKEDYQGAAEAITWWNKATIDGRKQVVPGLARRRAAEQALFLRDLDALENETPSTGMTIEENKPRRNNPVNSRTTAGAATGGAAGATGAGAVIMDRVLEGGSDDGDAGATPGTGTDTGGTTVPPSGTATDTGSTGETDTTTDEVPSSSSTAEDSTQTGEDTAEAADGWGDESEWEESAEAAAAADQGDDGADAAAGDQPMTTGTEVPADQPSGSLDKDDVTDTIVVIAGVLAVLAFIYVVIARVDDWLKFRR